jgi:hypothetical protein
VAVLCEQKAQPGGWAPERLSSLGQLGYAVGLRAFLTLYDFKLNLIAFLKTLVTFRLYGAVVNEHIGAVILADESETFGVVKPLDCASNTSRFHAIYVSFWDRTCEADPSFQNFPWGLRKESFLDTLSGERGTASRGIL